MQRAEEDVMRQTNIIARAIGFALAFLIAASAPAAMAHEKPLEAANKKVVLDFYQALNDADGAGTMARAIPGIAEKYLSPDYVQHAEMFASLPGPGSPRDKLIRMFQTMPPRPPMPPAKLISIMAKDDKVMMLTMREIPDPASGKLKASYIFNMFRVKNGQLSEHWDVQSMAPPPGPPMPDANGAGHAPPPPVCAAGSNAC